LWLIPQAEGAKLEAFLNDKIQHYIGLFFYPIAPIPLRILHTLAVGLQHIGCLCVIFK
jgi:hypothetical protein